MEAMNQSSYTGPGGFSTDRIRHLVLNGSTYNGDLMWNRTVPVSNRSGVNRVDPYHSGSDRIGSCVNVALQLGKSDGIQGFQFGNLLFATMVHRAFEFKRRILILLIECNLVSYRCTRQIT